MSRTRPFGAAVLAAVAAWSQVRADGPDPADVAAIKGQVALYAKSIDAADTALAAKVWADTPEVSFIHPRGHERGWKQVKENFYEKTMGAMFAERKLTTKDLEVQVFGDTAVVVFYWEFAAKVKGGPPLTTKGRETQVFRKTAAGWRLVHVHYSGLPVTGKRDGF